MRPEEYVPSLRDLVALRDRSPAADDALFQAIRTGVVARDEVREVFDAALTRLSEMLIRLWREEEAAG